MARKAKHDQRELSTSFRCQMCQIGVCSRCIDVARMIVNMDGTLCQCKRDTHDLEVTMTVEAAVDEHTSSEGSAPAYRYRDASLQVIWQTSVPKDDEAALAYFHAVCRFSKDAKPVYCEAIERGEDGMGPETYRMLNEIFDPETFSTKPFGL
jgi:hypothetical protein